MTACGGAGVAVAGAAAYAGVALARLPKGPPRVDVRPETLRSPWREFVEEQDATLERDTTTEVGTLPATLIQYSFTTNGIPTRERVVVVASRDLVLLQQPVPMQGETEAPAWFDEHVDEFDALLESIRFGAPEDYLDE